MHSDWFSGFCHITQDADFSKTWGFCRKLEDHYYLHIQIKKVHINWIRFLSKPQKHHFGAIFGPPCLDGIFFKNQASALFLLYDYPASCKKLEKNSEPILRSGVVKERTNGWMDERTYRRMNEQMNKRTDKRAKFVVHFH